MSSSRPAATRSTSPAAPLTAPMQLAVQHEAGAEAGAHRQKDEVLDTACGPAPALADGREIDVVLDGHRQLEPGPQVRRPVAALETGDVGRERQPARVRVDDARQSDDGAVDPVGREVARLRQRDPQGPRLPRSPPRRRRRRARRPDRHGRRRGDRRSHRARSGRGGRVRARDPPPGRSRRTSRRRWGAQGWDPFRARAPPRAATGARATRSASRSRRGGRSPRARWARPPGSCRAPSARSDP